MREIEFDDALLSCEILYTYTSNEYRPLAVDHVSECEFDTESLMARRDGTLECAILTLDSDIPRGVIGEPTQLSIDPDANTMNVIATYVVLMTYVRIVDVAHCCAFVECNAELSIGKNDRTRHMQSIQRPHTCVSKDDGKRQDYAASIGTGRCFDIRSTRKRRS